jgi:hypothetical protein
MAPEERAIVVVTHSVERFVRVEAFDVEMENSLMELIQYVITCWSGKK